MTDQILFTPYTLGDLTLSNRVVLAPLTRNRAGKALYRASSLPLTTARERRQAC